MINRFTDCTTHLLNEYLFRLKSEHIDGEARTRMYKILKDQSQLHQLLERNGELNFQNKWVDKVLEEYITAHEGTWGNNEDENKLSVYKALKGLKNLHLLFEEHYSFNADLLL